MKGDDGVCGGLRRGELQGRETEKRALKQGQLPGDLFIEMKHRFPKCTPLTETHDS